MKIVFTGTSEFALSTLQTLISSHHEICAVYTQPDRPAGRGQRLTASPVKILALANNLPLYQPLTLKDPAVQKQLQELNSDILINVAYGLLVPEIILNTPRLGCINIHPSLLPRWRGAAPIQRSIMAGDTITGVTIMKMDVGLDTGDIYKQITLPIEDTDTTATLMQKTSEIGAKLLLEVLAEIEAGTIKATPQNNTHTTYANKILKEEGKINWQQSAKEIDCMIRAFNPWPIAFTEVDDQYIRIWEAKITPTEHIQNTLTKSPGTIIQANKNGIDILTGNGVLRLLKLQLPGGKPLQAGDIINSNQKIFTIEKRLL